MRPQWLKVRLWGEGCLCESMIWTKLKLSFYGIFDHDISKVCSDRWHFFNHLYVNAHLDVHIWWWSKSLPVWRVTSSELNWTKLIGLGRCDNNCQSAISVYALRINFMSTPSKNRPFGEIENDTGWEVNIGSGNGLVQWGNMPSPETILCFPFYVRDVTSSVMGISFSNTTYSHHLILLSQHIHPFNIRTSNSILNIISWYIIIYRMVYWYFSLKLASPIDFIDCIEFKLLNIWSGWY